MTCSFLQEPPARQQIRQQGAGTANADGREIGEPHEERVDRFVEPAVPWRFV